MRAAVLGGTGFVGRHVCAELARRGYQVLAVARNHAAHAFDYKFLSLDLVSSESEKLVELIQTARADVVVNATGYWGRTEQAMIDTHVRLVHRLVHAVGAVPHRPRLIQLGSLHEYGAPPASMGRAAVHECVEPNPTTTFGRTKLVATRAVLDATRDDAVDGVVLRLADVYGPHARPGGELGRLLAELRGMTAGREHEPRVEDARRDLVDVRDVAVAVAEAARASVVGRVINIGRGAEIGMRELAALLAEEAGLSVRVSGRVRGRRNGRAGRGRADIRLAGELLGWAPRMSPRESVRDMWAASAPGDRA